MTAFTEFNSTAMAQTQDDRENVMVDQGCVRIYIGNQRQPAPIWAVPLSRIRQSRWYRGMRCMLREIGNCYHRILRMREIQWGQMGVDMDRDHLQLQHVPREVLIANTRARMRGIEDLYSTRPYSTILDAELFLQGWIRAEAALHRTLDTVSSTQNDSPPFVKPPTGVII